MLLLKQEALNNFFSIHKLLVKYFPSGYEPLCDKQRGERAVQHKPARGNQGLQTPGVRARSAAAWSSGTNLVTTKRGKPDVGRNIRIATIPSPRPAAALCFVFPVTYLAKFYFLHASTTKFPVPFPGTIHGTRCLYHSPLGRVFCPQRLTRKTQD